MLKWNCNAILWMIATMSTAYSTGTIFGLASIEDCDPVLDDKAPTRPCQSRSFLLDAVVNRPGRRSNIMSLVHEQQLRISVFRLAVMTCL